MFVSYTSERTFSRTCSRIAFAKNICPLIFERNVTAIESTYLVLQEKLANKVIRKFVRHFRIGLMYKTV